jgi:hypothetical protein
MKAERRHDLKTNTLARGIEGVPGYWREYGSRILLGVTLFLVLFLLARFWMQRRQQEQMAIDAAQGNALSAIQQLDSLPREYTAGLSSSEFIARQRDALVQEAESAIDTLLNSKDPQKLAAGYVARGDLNWRLATLPPIPGAETRPTLAVSKSSKELWDAAKQAYQRVLEPPLNESLYAVINARLSLAAVAENEHDWDTAKRHYQALIDDPKLQSYPGYKDYAKQRMELLTQMPTPTLLMPPSTQAATTRSVLGPFPMPSTSPATAPSTAPATSEPVTTQATTAPATQVGSDR